MRYNLSMPHKRVSGTKKTNATVVSVIYKTATAEKKINHSFPVSVAGRLIPVFSPFL